MDETGDVRALMTDAEPYIPVVTRLPEALQDEAEAIAEAEAAQRKAEADKAAQAVKAADAAEAERAAAEAKGYAEDEARLKRESE
jgi:regulator of protease activity HflC (stomatin/prohibitin superfamily)